MNPSDEELQVDDILAEQDEHTAGPSRVSSPIADKDLDFDRDDNYLTDSQIEEILENSVEVKPKNENEIVMDAEGTVVHEIRRDR